MSTSFIQRLFKECDHLNEKQRLELKRRIYLKIRRDKFWFEEHEGVYK